MMNQDPPPDRRRIALEEWLARSLGAQPARVAPASEDASFRRYFRVWHQGGTWIAMDAPPDKEDLHAFARVAAILAKTGVNVPRVVASDFTGGFLLLTDLGSRHYLQALRAGEDPEPLYEAAIAALVRMQSGATEAASSLPAYDARRLRQEMELFPVWFLQRHLGLDLAPPELAMIGRSFGILEAAALAQPQVLVHRDYHSRNLMVCAPNPGILDFQDAVIGPQSYDLVSLLKDCYIAWPRERVLAWVARYLDEARAAGIVPPGSSDDFVHDFDLMGLQRHLKVLGIFARLWYRDGKPSYLADLPLVLDYVLAATASAPLLEDLGGFLRERVVPAFPGAQSRVLAAR